MQRGEDRQRIGENYKKNSETAQAIELRDALAAADGVSLSCGFH